MEINSTIDMSSMQSSTSRGLQPQASVHPEYVANTADWKKFRDIIVSGHAFVDTYLEKFSTRESDTEFLTRKRISCCAAHAKAALIEVKNALYQRFCDINRSGGPVSYVQAIKTTVDRVGNSINSFIGNKVVMELVGMGKVAIYVDRPQFTSLMPTRLEASRKSPYLYTYTAEDIRNWAYNTEGKLVSLLLRDRVMELDETTGLPTFEKLQYRLLRLTDAAVEVSIFDNTGKLILESALNLTSIPCVILSLSTSLLIDIADYQIALTNMNSADIAYVMKADFPVFTEQFDPTTEMFDIRQSMEGTAVEANTAKPKQTDLGIGHGRRYPKGLERPDFIHPSPEPLTASMDKQEQLKKDIRTILTLTLASVEPRRASAESRKQDNQGKEEGLSYIGLELEYGEREIGKIWTDYEGGPSSAPTINYPKTYSLRTDADRREEAAELSRLIPSLPSKTYQREVGKGIATTTLGHKIPDSTLEKIHAEIDAAEVIVTDPDIIAKDLENGLVGNDLASRARGYPEGEVEKAAKDHAERAIRILQAQTSMATRGMPDLGTDPKASGVAEKMMNKENRSMDPNNQDPVRGNGKG